MRLVDWLDMLVLRMGSQTIGLAVGISKVLALGWRLEIYWHIAEENSKQEIILLSLS